MRESAISEKLFENNKEKWENHSKRKIRLDIFDIDHSSMEKVPLDMDPMDKDPEELVASYYRDKGYKVHNADSEGTISEEIPDAVRQKLELNKFERKFSEEYTPDEIISRLRDDLDNLEKGFPDLIVYDLFDGELRELKLVEVKSENDSLHYNQVRWFLTSSPKLNTKIVWIREGKHD